VVGQFDESKETAECRSSSMRARSPSASRRAGFRLAGERDDSIGEAEGISGSQLVHVREVIQQEKQTYSEKYDKRHSGSRLAVYFGH
jgi:hypothetical protein